MSNQSLTGDATQKQTQSTFETALQEALDNFHGLMVNEKASGDNSSNYWKAVADNAHSQLAQAKAKGEAANPLIELLAAIPDFMFTQLALDAAREQHNRDAFLETRRRAIHFNDLVSEVVHAFPGIHASALENVLVDTAEGTITNQNLRQMIPSIMHSVIRGAQHEVAFGQLLEQTGRTFQQGNINEDAHGIDFIVQSPHGEMHIDVKSSLYEITKRGEYHHKYVIDNGDGLVTMYSLVDDAELGDFFDVEPRVAEKKSGELESILQVIESGDQAALVNHPAIIHSVDK